MTPPSGVDGAAALIDAWFDEPTAEANAEHLRFLTAQDPAAAEELVLGLTKVAAGLTYSLAQVIHAPMPEVLATVSEAVKPGD